MRKILTVRLAYLLLLAIRVRIAMISDRRWPMWFGRIPATGILIGFFVLELRLRCAVAGAFASSAIPAIIVMVVRLLVDRINGIGDDFQSRDIVLHDFIYR